MKYAILILGLVLLVACGGSPPEASFQLTPQDTVKNVFDVERFNQHKLVDYGYEHYEFTENGVYVKQSRQDTFYSEDRFYPDSLLGDDHRYYMTGKMMSKCRFFVKGGFPVGRRIHFDPKGAVVQAEDWDAPYAFSLADVLAFMLREGIDIRWKSTRVYRGGTVGLETDPSVDLYGIKAGIYVWEVFYSLPDTRDRRIILDGQTGELLLDSLYGEATVLPPSRP